MKMLDALLKLCDSFHCFTAHPFDAAIGPFAGVLKRVEFILSFLAKTFVQTVIVIFQTPNLLKEFDISFERRD